MKQLINLIKTYGVKDFCWKSYEKLHNPMKEYSKCYKEYLPDEEELRRQRTTSFSLEPRISIVVPAYETNIVFLRQLIDSVLAQTYSKWQLCIADGSSSDVVENYISTHYHLEERVVYKHLKQNGGIAANTNAAIELACGEYICFADHDDILSPNALFEMVAALNKHPKGELFYSDEDKVSEDLTVYLDPHFKPDFNEKLLRSYNYICHLVMIAKTLADRVGLLCGEYDGAQDYDYMLRCTEEAKEIIHVPKILYHWRICEGSTAGNSLNKNYARDGGEKALEAYLSRKKIDGAKVAGRIDSGSYQIHYETRENKKFAILKPNASDEEILNADADYIVFVDENVTLQNGWDKELFGVLGLPEVGMVGGKIVNGTKIWADGIYTSEQSGIIRGFENLPIHYRGYQKRAVLTQNVEAVSLQFAALKKSVYQRLIELQGAERQQKYLENSVTLEERSLLIGNLIRKLGLEVVLVPDVIAKYRFNSNGNKENAVSVRKTTIKFDRNFMPPNLVQGNDGQWYLKK